MPLRMGGNEALFVLLYLIQYGFPQSILNDYILPPTMPESSVDSEKSDWDMPPQLPSFPNNPNPKTDVFSCICKDDEEDDSVSSKILEHCGNGICNTSVACFSHLKHDNLKKVSKGCMLWSHQHRFMCNTKTSELICCETNMCNQDLYPASPTSDTPGNETNTPTTLIITMISLFLGFILLCLIALFLVRRRHRRRMQELEDEREAGKLEGGLRTTNIGDSTLADWMNSATSGSGSGLPLLAQRTVARQITLVNCIGKGRYGEVWKGMWQGEPVAVKIFASRDEQSWSRETEIYNTVLLRHSSILGYIASDMTSRNSETQLWLVCYYHQFGSLYEFLQYRELDKHLTLKLCLTAATGIAHLHTDISGVCGKAAIAHRDIKTKNVLVKDDLTCCIADLGLAVTHDPAEGKLTVPKNNNRVGTKRYMPPEVLEETLNTRSFACFKQADVYSFALVLWEVARRCRCGGIVDEYNPPYYDMVNLDPSFEEMRKVVSVDGCRPDQPDRWTADPTLSLITKIMEETWCKNPSSRLPILRVKKTLMKAADQLAHEKMTLDNLSDDKDPLISLLPKKMSDVSYADNSV